jgi:hypothetical protein
MGRGVSVARERKPVNEGEPARWDPLTNKRTPGGPGVRCGELGESDSQIQGYADFFSGFVEGSAGVGS